MSNNSTYLNIVHIPDQRLCWNWSQCHPVSRASVRSILRCSSWLITVLYELTAVCLLAHCRTRTCFWLYLIHAFTLYLLCSLLRSREVSVSLLISVSVLGSISYADDTKWFSSEIWRHLAYKVYPGVIGTWLILCRYGIARWFVQSFKANKQIQDSGLVTNPASFATREMY